MLSELDAATPLVSEQEDDFPVTSPRKTHKRKPYNPNEPTRGERRKKSRTIQTVKTKLDFLQDIGFEVYRRTLDGLTGVEILDLGRKWNVIPGEEHTEEDPYRVTMINLDKWVPYWKRENNISDTSAMFANDKPGITEQALRDKGFKFLTFGAVYGYQEENGRDILVFSVRFYPRTLPEGEKHFLSSKELEDMDLLASQFYEIREMTNPIKVNKAHKDAHQVGSMHGLGLRQGTDGGYKMGGYAPTPSYRSKLGWDTRSGTEELVGSICTHFFRKIAPGACQAAVDFFEKYDLPGVGATTFGDRPSAPASSLYISHTNFYNSIHCDNDVSPVAFGIWFTTRAGKLVTSPDETAKNIHGGQFFFPDYGIAIDFNRCGGITCVTWRAPQDRHATAFTETVAASPEYIRWGSSIQLSEGVFKARKDIAETGGDVRDAAAYMAGRKGSGVGIKSKPKQKDKRVSKFNDIYD